MTLDSPSKTNLNNQNTAYLFILIVILGLFAYWPSFWSSFQFDDFPAIVENQSIKNLADPVSIWKFYKSRCVAFFSFAFNYDISGLNPLGYHVTNYGIHFFNALMLFWLVKQLIYVLRRGDNIYFSDRLFIASGAAAIFLLHPIQTQAVTYIHQRTTSLAVFFYLICVNIYVFVRKQSGGTQKVRRQAQILLYGMAAFSGVLSLLTKEIAASLPFLLMCLEYCFFQKEKGISFNLGRAKAGLRVLIILLLLMAVLVPLIYQFNPVDRLLESRISQSHDGDVITVWGNFITQFKAMAVYMRLWLFPVGQNLDYDFAMLKTPFDIYVLAALMMICGCVYYLRKRGFQNILVSFFILWVAINFLHIFIPRENIFFEHNLYLPSVGLSVLSMCTIVRFIGKPQFRFILMCLLLLVLSVWTHQRNTVWLTQESLWSDVVEKSPFKSRGHATLGGLYFQKGKMKRAKRYFDRALELNEKNILALIYRGNWYKKNGEFEAALNDYNKALRESNPVSHAHIWTNRGNLYELMGERELAFEDYAKAIKSKYYLAYNNRGSLYKKVGDYQKALKDLNESVAINPNFDTSYYNRALVYVKLGNFDEALSDLNRALSINPMFAAAYMNRGVLFRIQGLLSPAMEDFNHAISIDPQSSNAYFNRGELKRIMGQPREALNDLNMCLRIDGKSGKAYFARSLVYVKIGQIEKAKKDALQAQSLGYPVESGYLKYIAQLLEKERG